MEAGKLTIQISIPLLWAKSQVRNGFVGHYALASLFICFHSHLEQAQTWPSAV